MTPDQDQAVLDARVAKRQLDQAEQALATAVWDMRDAGLSWAHVAGVLGTTRQSAWRKYGLTGESQD